MRSIVASAYNQSQTGRSFQLALMSSASSVSLFGQVSSSLSCYTPFRLRGRTSHGCVHAENAYLHVCVPEQSRRCPLCSQGIGDYLIHHIRSKYDYQKHYLPPLRASPRSLGLVLDAQRDARRRAQTRREREWGRRRRQEQEEADELEKAIETRRWVYHHHLYAKVCDLRASN